MTEHATRRTDESTRGRTADAEDPGRRYRFERLALPLVLKDLYFGKSDPGPGDRVPEFDLPAVGGGRFRSADLANTGPALLVFGSSTCPVTDNAAPGLIELHRRFGDRVRFVMVNVREAHPGCAFPQPGTPEASSSTRSGSGTSTASRSKWPSTTWTALCTAHSAPSPTRPT
jgi:thiol-disulfide isomerase/thioredoxin